MTNLLRTSLLLVLFTTLCIPGTNQSILDSRCISTTNFVTSAVSGTTFGKTFSIKNNNPAPLVIDAITITGADAALFTVTTGLPLTIAAESSGSVNINFKPTSVGVKTADMDISSGGETVFSVDVRGLSTIGTGGLKEPSLQSVLDGWGLPINVGDNDPSSTLLYDSDATKLNSLLGPDEIELQRLVKADPDRVVSIEVLSVFGVTTKNPAVAFGWYVAGDPNSPQEAFEVTNTPESNGQSLAPPVDGDLFMDPQNETFGLYTRWPFFGERLVYSEDYLNTWDPNLKHHVRVYPFTKPDGTVVPNSYVVAFEEYTAAYDFQDIVVVVHNVKKAPQFQVVNALASRGDGGKLVPGFYDDYIVSHRINQGLTMFPLTSDHYFRNVSVVRVKNNDDKKTLDITSIVLEKPDFFEILSGGQVPFTLPPLGYRDIRVLFKAAGGNKGMRFSSLTIGSNDPLKATKTVTLAGMYQIYPEGNNEFKLQDMLNAFGVHINVGKSPSELVANPLNGDEIRSRFWQRANPRKPVYVSQIAAFHNCCNTTATLKLGGGTLQHHVFYGQSIYPALKSDISRNCEMTVNPTTSFPIVIDGKHTTDWEGIRIAVYLFPLRNKEDKVEPNSYIIVQDYVINGCGTEPGQGNCDFNDNIYIVTNIMPTDYQNDPDEVVSLDDSRLSIDFAAPVANTLQDKNGAGIGFTHTMVNRLDVSEGSNSYNKELIALNAGSLSLTSAGGSNKGEENSLVNGLTLNFDGRVQDYVVTASLVGPFTFAANQEAGVFIAGGYDNFVQLALTSKNNALTLQLYAEINDLGLPTGEVIASVALPANLQKIELGLVGMPTTGSLKAMYRADGGSSYVVLPVIGIPESRRGRFFGAVSKGGIFASSFQATAAVTVAFDRFTISAGDPASSGLIDHDFAFCVIPTAPLTTVGGSVPSTIFTPPTGLEFTTDGSVGGSTTLSTDPSEGSGSTDSSESTGNSATTSDASTTSADTTSAVTSGATSDTSVTTGSENNTNGNTSDGTSDVTNSEENIESASDKLTPVIISLVTLAIALIA